MVSQRVATRFTLATLIGEKAAATEFSQATRALRTLARTPRRGPNHTTRSATADSDLDRHGGHVRPSGMNADNAEAIGQKTPVPKDWENAGITSMVNIATSHQKWIEDQAQRLGLFRYLDADVKNGIGVIFLAAQAEHWRKKAKQLDTPENRNRARKEAAAQIAKVIFKNFKEPDQKKLPSALRTLGVSSPEETLMWNYDWRAPSHGSLQLRTTLGYSERYFRKLAKQICGDARDHPWMDNGKGNRYSSVIALRMLRHRLDRIDAEQRRQLYAAISFWQRSLRGDTCYLLEGILGRLKQHSTGAGTAG